MCQEFIRPENALYCAYRLFVHSICSDPAKHHGEHSQFERKMVPLTLGSHFPHIKVVCVSV